MDPLLTDVLGYAAAALVLATFSVRSIVPLRMVAIASNLLFIAYAASAHLLPVLVLHALLLPLNAWRLRQALREPAAKDASRPIAPVAAHASLPWTASDRAQVTLAPTRLPSLASERGRQHGRGRGDLHVVRSKATRRS